MRTKDIAKLRLATTPNPISSGRKSDFYPVLVLVDDPPQAVTVVLEQYPGCTVREPLDRHLHPIEDVFEIMSPNQRKVARYRYIEKAGWLEEISPNWTVNGDYPSSLAASYVSNLPDQGQMNVATAMRFGILLVAYLLGADQEHIRHFLVKIVGELLTRPVRTDAIRIEGGQIVLII